MTPCRRPICIYLAEMPGSSEVEVKFKVSEVEALLLELRQLSLRPVTPRTHEMNTLFDLPGHPLRKRGELLRLRKYGEIWVLTHKAKAKNQGGLHKTRIETETRVEDGEKMGAILRALQFEPVFRYEKFRAEWEGEQGHVVVDETPIGNFAEIEGSPDWIDAMARQLGIAPTDYITETYAGLFFAWKKQMGSQAQEMTFQAVGAAANF
jgi:adenylate cyclase, class 2